LTLQIRDLLFVIRDSLPLFGNLLRRFANLLFLIGKLLAQPFVFSCQIVRLRVAVQRTHSTIPVAESDQFVPAP
jgi:hypothetical protein